MIQIYLGSDGTRAIIGIDGEDLHASGAMPGGPSYSMIEGSLGGLRKLRDALQGMEL